MMQNKEKEPIFSFVLFAQVLYFNLLSAETALQYSAKNAFFHGKTRMIHALKSVLATKRLNGGRCIDSLNKI
jgi:hypothetical protein